MSFSLKLLTAALTLALVPVVSPAEGACRLTNAGVSVCREDVWFHQAAANPGNLAAAGLDTYPSWNTTKPTDSVTAGAGGGYIGTSAFHQFNVPWDPTGTPTFEGSFTGEIDTLAVTLYLFTSPAKYTEPLLPVNVQLTVDGEVVVELDNIVLAKHSAGGDVVRRVDFAFVNLYTALSDLGLSGAGTHAIRLAVVGTGLGTGAALWVYDTSEVPSGMVFNIESVEGYTEIAAA